MKKCKGCQQEIDKYAIACEYCGKLNEGRGGSDKENHRGKDPQKEQKR